MFSEMDPAGVNNSEIGHLGVTESAIRRMPEPEHENKADKTEGALRALGKEAIIDITMPPGLLPAGQRLTRSLYATRRMRAPAAASLDSIFS